MTAQNPAAGKPVDPSSLVNVPPTGYGLFRVETGSVRSHPARCLRNLGPSRHFAEELVQRKPYPGDDAGDLRSPPRTGLTGPLFVGIDTHALAEPALVSAMEVFAANGVDIMIDERGGYTPTPVISHAILSYNKGRTSGLADGVVISPSHNPPEDGGYKYNPPHGGPADTDVTAKVEKAANAYMEADMKGVARMPYARARKAPSTHLHDYIRPYVADLGNAVDMALIKSSGVKIGIDPLGGAAVHYWQPLIEHYGINATVVNDRGRSDVPFHDSGLGWKNPDGLFLAVRDGEPDCDARQVRRRLCQ